MIQHKKKFGVYHWDTFDNETFLQFESNDFNECEKWVETHYEGRISASGADQVDLVDSDGDILKKWNVK